MNHRDKQKRISAEVIIDGSPGKTGERIAGGVFLGQQKASLGIRIVGVLVILAGIILFFLVQDVGSGSFELEIPRAFTFKGGFSGLLVCTGAFLIWQSTPKVKIRIIQSSNDKL